MQIKTNLKQSNMTDPNIPQSKFYMQKVEAAAFPAYQKTDMLQVMALSTRAILQKVQGQDELEDTFSIMYTPMDTGEYKELSSDAVSNIAGLIYEILPFVLAMTLMNIREPEEDTIDLIMKRLGVQKSVLVLRDLVPGLVFQGFWTFIAGFAMWGGLFHGKLGLGPIIVISIFYTLQANLRGIIIT